MSKLVAQVALGGATVAAALATLMPGWTTVSDDPSKSYASIDLGLWHAALQLPSSKRYCSKLAQADCALETTLGQCSWEKAACDVSSSIPHLNRGYTLSTAIELPKAHDAVIAARVTAMVTLAALLGSFGAAFADAPRILLGGATLAIATGIATLLIWKLAIAPDPKTDAESIVKNLVPQFLPPILQNPLNKWLEGQFPKQTTGVEGMSGRDGSAYWILVGALGLAVVGAGAAGVKALA